ncbi:DUF3006 domain-containing protein [Hathewaya histolytica]|uniref:DUF3006 domain-containing protein n=1 Tax=Hathewaya histolytica TaxID=1498 RepID=UPI003B67E26F
MKGILDRFEGNYAVVEITEGKTIDIPKDIIPKDAREGTILNLEINVTIDEKDTSNRKKEIEKLMDDLWK